jgi:serine/threonine protein kinase/tetratricopeptide (TPR) repeat protein
MSSRASRPSLARYEVLGRLASGGLGDVWLGRASGPAGFEKLVVLKTIRSDGESSELATTMFLREARVAALLSHSNCVQVFDFGEENGTYFIAMEYLAGFTLARTLQRGVQVDRPMPIGVFARIVLDACAGLEYAHTLKDNQGALLGLIHRDISLDNIVVTFAGQTKLVDFGLAKATAALGGERTASGVVKGKSGYMAPEYLRGEQPDARVDLFALGVVMYRALAHEKPFGGASEAQVMATMLAYRTPPSPREHDARVPEPLDVVVRKALEPDPADRFESAREMRVALAAAVPDAGDADAVASYLASLWPEDDPERAEVPRLLASESTPPADLRPPRRPAHRTPRGVIAAAAIIALALGAVTVWLARRTRDATPPSVAPVAERAHAPVSVLIADFTNRTSDQIFDGTLEPAFAVALETVPFITASNRAAALRTAAKLKSDATTLDPKTAQLVAMRDGIAVVLVGSIERVGERYRTEVTLVDSMTGKPITTEDVTADTKEGVLHSIAKLGAKLGQALGDTAPESVRLAAADTYSTGSLEAAHVYANAKALEIRGDYEHALTLYEQAVALDPQMARAYTGIAVVYVNRGRLQEADKFYKLAFPLLDRVTARERLRTRGVYFLVKGDLDSAVQELGQLVAQYPADTAGLVNLAITYCMRRDFTKAAEIGRRGIEAQRESVVAQGNLGMYLFYGGDLDGATVLLEKARQTNPAFLAPYQVLAMIAVVRGDLDRATAIWNDLVARGPDGASRAAEGLADIALYRGRADEAVDTLEKGITGDLAAKNTDAAALKGVRLAHAYTVLGERAKAAKAIEDALRASREPAILFWAARGYIELGDDAHARPLVSELESQIGQQPHAHALLLSGELLLAHGDAPGAIAKLQEAEHVLDTWLGRLDLARAYLAASEREKARSQIETLTRRRSEGASIMIDEEPTTYLLPELDALRNTAGGGR